MQILNVSDQTVIYRVSIHTDPDSVQLRFWYSLWHFSSARLCPRCHLRSPNCRPVWDFKMMFFLTFMCFTFLRLNLCAALYLRTVCNFCSHRIMISMAASSSEILYIGYISMPSLVYKYMINLSVFPSGEVQVYLWKFQCRNILMLTTGFF
jgi:hypothetical protein